MDEVCVVCCLFSGDGNFSAYSQEERKSKERGKADHVEEGGEWAEQGPRITGRKQGMGTGLGLEEGSLGEAAKA